MGNPLADKAADITATCRTTPRLLAGWRTRRMANQVPDSFSESPFETAAAASRSHLQRDDWGCAVPMSPRLRDILALGATDDTNDPQPLT
jgi:hypothetical protein